MTPIKNHIMFSELKEIDSMEKLDEISISVFQQGLEGIVIKYKYGIYEPGKRHWLKLKEDYLTKGGKGMADSADMVVLGGYYGTGRKGGIMSVLLMGCLDEYSGKWCTVTKVPGGDDATLKKLLMGCLDEYSGKWCTVTKFLGGDDATLKKLQKELNVKKINKDQSQVSLWLNINKALVPDFVTVDPKKSNLSSSSKIVFDDSGVESH